MTIPNEIDMLKGFMNTLEDQPKEEPTMINEPTNEELDEMEEAYRQECQDKEEEATMTTETKEKKEVKRAVFDVIIGGSTRQGTVAWSYAVYYKGKHLLGDKGRYASPASKMGDIAGEMAAVMRALVLLEKKLKGSAYAVRVFSSSNSLVKLSNTEWEARNDFTQKYVMFLYERPVHFRGAGNNQTVAKLLGMAKQSAKEVK